MRKIILLIVLFFAVEAKAAVFTIANGDVAGLIAAINTANANSEADIINLASNGTYTLTAINFTSSNPNTTGNASQRGLPRILDNVVGLDLTINANGSTIQRDNTAPNFGIFSIAGQTIINDLTIRNGRVNAQGAGIFVEFKGNTELNNCKFYDNTSTLDVEGGGGAIYTKSLSVLRVTNCYFENNKAINQGGAISNLLSNLYVLNSTFKNNGTTDLIGGDPCGGAIYDDGARGDNGELVIRGCTFEGNTSNGQGQGGAMFLFPYNSQSVEVTGCTFKSNSANQGGAFWHKGGGSSGIPDPEYPLSAAAENTTLLFNTCVFDGNTALNASGGALWISDCKVNEIHSCTFKNNTADLGGAMALLTNRAFTLRNTTFNNNTANQAGAIFAGGITGKLTVQNCTFAANIANQYGGAMAVPQNATPVDIINCTFANNQANNPVNGQSGAIHSGNNTPNNTVTIKNNIFTNNTVTNAWNSWRDCNCILNDGGNNLFFPAGVTTNCVTAPNFVNPLVGTLSDNGGLTQTIPILAGSPAINAGVAAPATDQRGVARVGAADIGAFEFGGTVCNLVVSSNADAGANTLREAINCATSGQTITFAPSMANQTITLASTLEIPVNKNLTINGLAAANLTISGNNAVRVFLLKSTSVQPTTLNLKNLKIINARTIEYGGGIKAEHQGTINLENCTLNNNRADDGGSAVCSAFEGYLTILNCSFDGNISTANNTERGSTVLVWGPYAQTIRNSNFTNNKGINGGAINGLNAGLLIEDCNFTNNLTTDARFDTGKPNDFLRGFGGAIYTDRASQGPPSVVLGSIILRRCKFENNIGNGEGGACYLYTDETDNVLVEQCYFNNNESRILTGGTNGGSGGAIQQMNNSKNRGFVIQNSTFSNNKAAVAAGAIRADWADTQITNCTFDNNRALLTTSTGWAANGGALAFFSMSNSFIDITNCTLANNYAGWSGGAITSSDPLRTRIKNNIFFQNTAGNGGNTWNIQQHASGEMLDLGNNLQFPNKFTTNWNDYNVSATVTIANPLLNTIANNGGFSPTMSLQAGSPAINAGAGCPTTDQRGNARVGICDIGAFEFGGVVTPTITVSPATLIGFSTIVGTASTAQTYNLKGSNLTTDITVTAPTDYEVSLNGTAFSNAVTATMASVQAVAGQTISVRIKASALVGSPAGDITNVSMGAVSKNVALTGSVTSILTAPEIQVLEGTTNIADNIGSINFGATVIGTSITKTFTIKNIGTADLTLGTLSALPTGFSLVGAFPNTAITAGTNATFQVKLDAIVAGTPTGSLSFVNNDADENPFNFTISGTVTAIVVPPIPPAPPTPPVPPVPPTPPAPPVYVAPPINIIAGQVTENQIIINWNLIANATQYAIERRLAGQTNFERVKTTENNANGLPSNTFSDNGLNPTESYEYRIIALTSTQPQPISAIVAISTIPAAPTATDGIICGSGSTALTVQANTTKTVTYKWYEKENDTNALQNTELTTFITPQIQQNTTFYVSTVFNGKESKKTAVNAVIKPLPTAKIKEGNGMQSNSISFCEKGVLNAEKVAGATYRWLLNNQEVGTGEILEVKFGGTYQVAVKYEGCEKISEPTNLIINALPIAQILQGESISFCRKGAIQAQIFSNITYEWTDEKGKILGSESILNLTQSGTYILKTKQNNCESKAAQIRVLIPPIIAAPKITANKTTICEGETLKMEVPQIDGASYHWQGMGLFAQTRMVEVPYNKYLQNAVYQVYITKDGCQSDIANIEIKISQPINFEVKTQNPNCFGSKDGTIEILTGSGVLPNSNLQFKINNQPFSKQLKFNDLGKGEYIITAKNELGCEQSQKVILNDPLDFKVVASEDVQASRFVSTQLTAVGAMRYEWLPSAGLDNPNIPNPKANPLQTTVYIVKGYNENGCVRTDEVIVTIIETENIITNKVLSPNNDGINDFWQITDIDKFPENRLVVYNRLGQRVYEAQNYQNNWDGKILDDGTYYFILFLPENKQLNGIITVAR